MNDNACKVGLHQCLQSVGSSSSPPNFHFHSSWMISLDSRVAGANIPGVSNIELIKLRMHPFDGGKDLIPALIGSLLEFHLALNVCTVLDEN